MLAYSYWTYTYLMLLVYWKIVLFVFLCFGTGLGHSLLPFFSQQKIFNIFTVFTQDKYTVYLNILYILLSTACLAICITIKYRIMTLKAIHEIAIISFKNKVLVSTFTSFAGDGSLTEWITPRESIVSIHTKCLLWILEFAGALRLTPDWASFFITLLWSDRNNPCQTCT